MVTENTTIKELIELLQKTTNKSNVDVVKEGNKLKIKVKCKICKKDHYVEFDLEGHRCKECWDNINEKVKKKLEEMGKTRNKNDCLSDTWDKFILELNLLNDEEEKEINRQRA